MGNLWPVYAQSGGRLLGLYVGLCSIFNVLSARAMHFGEFAIRAQDLLCLVQLPGVVISGSAFFVATLTRKRNWAWDVIAVLAIVCSILGIALMILLVALPSYPSPFHHLTPKELSILRTVGRRASSTVWEYIDAFAAFALVVLDGWFCMACVALLGRARGADRERAA